MYAFTPDQSLCLAYEDFYLAIGYTFYEIINNKNKLLFPDVSTNSRQIKSIIELQLYKKIKHKIK